MRNLGSKQGSCVLGKTRCVCACVTFLWMCAMSNACPAVCVMKDVLLYLETSIFEC